MDHVNMARRCPGARSMGRAMLADHRLCFRRWRAWRTGVGHVERAHGAHVWGVLWEIDDKHERSLDRYEGVAGGLYTKGTVTVDRDGEQVEAMIYLAIPVSPKRPSARYLALLVRGAQAHGAPEAYVAALRAARARSTRSP